MLRGGVVVVASVVLSGCSLLFMEKPPAGDSPVARGDCTRSTVAPVLDVLGGLGSLAYAVGAVGDDSTDEESAAIKRGGATLSVLYTYSAVRGFGWSAGCKRRNALSEQAIADHLRKLAEMQTSKRSADEKIQLTGERPIE